MAWLGADAVVGVHLARRHGIRSLDAVGVVVVALQVADAFGVVVVVPGGDDRLGTHELDGEHEVVGGYRDAVRPARLRVQPVVDAPTVGTEGPMRGQGGDCPAGIRMKGDGAELVGTQKTCERSVGVRPHPAQGERETGDRCVEGAAALGIGRGEHRILVVGDPDQVFRQRVRQTVPRHDLDRGLLHCGLR